MIADIFTKALPKILHKRHMNETLSDLPTEIANIAKSSITSPDLSPSVEKGRISEDCKLALEGGPELEGSPCVHDATNAKSRVLEYACRISRDLSPQWRRGLHDKTRPSCQTRSRLSCPLSSHNIQA